MTDIIEQLYTAELLDQQSWKDLCEDAANEIETLRQRVKELEANYAAVAHNIASSPAKVLEESVLIGQTLNRLDKVQQALLSEREVSDKLEKALRIVGHRPGEERR